MNPIKLDAIKPDQTFKGELLLDKSFLLLGSGQKITTELIKNLMTWNITELYIDASATPAPSIAQFTEDTDTDEFITLEKKENEATIQRRQGLYVACIEEISYRNGWLSKDQILNLAKESKTDYGRYLEFVANTFNQSEV